MGNLKSKPLGSSYPVPKVVDTFSWDVADDVKGKEFQVKCHQGVITINPPIYFFKPGRIKKNSQRIMICSTTKCKELIVSNYSGEFDILVSSDGSVVAIGIY